MFFSFCFSFCFHFFSILFSFFFHFVFILFFILFSFCFHFVFILFFILFSFCFHFVFHFVFDSTEFSQIRQILTATSPIYRIQFHPLRCSEEEARDSRLDSREEQDQDFENFETEVWIEKQTSLEFQ